MKRMEHTVWTVVLLAVLGSGIGCGGSPDVIVVDPVSGERLTEGEVRLLEQVLDGTVGQLAYLEGGAPLTARGYGLVVGLAGKGSGEAPASVRERLVKEMGRRGIGDVTTGTAVLSPNKLIDDPDTAVVVVSAVIPPGAPEGTRVDVAVASLPKSQTLSLDGGTLFTTDLQAVSVSNGAVKESRILGTAKGPVFVNPFGVGGPASVAASQRIGRVIGGGVTVENRVVRLVLRQPDYRYSRLLQEAINAQYPELTKVAVARTPSAVEIRIPPKHRGDYDEFLQGLTHVYIRRGSGAADRKARQLAHLIRQPGAPYEDISLIWETMGRKVAPVVRDLYTDQDPVVSFWSARTGARVGDPAAIDVLARLAWEPTELRLQAIAELGRTGSLTAVKPLTKLLDADDAVVRVAAYEAMIAGGLAGQIACYDVDGQFELHTVSSVGDYLVYVTRTGTPRIVLFGDGIQLRRPVFFTTPDDLVTINANDPAGKVSVYRRTGARRQLSSAMEVTPDLKSLILAMGKIPAVDKSGKIHGLGLTYSQVAGVLYRLCEDKAGKKVPAGFVLQKPDGTDRISSGMAPVGRQNTADGP